MPRANRHFLPGYVWHITHQRCSQFQSFQSFNRCASFAEAYGRKFAGESEALRFQTLSCGMKLLIRQRKLGPTRYISANRQGARDFRATITMAIGNA